MKTKNRMNGRLMALLVGVSLYGNLVSCGKSPLIKGKREDLHKRPHANSVNPSTDSSRPTEELPGEVLTFSQLGLKAQLKWLNGPSVDEESAFILYLRSIHNDEGSTNSLKNMNLKDQLQVELWMPDMGHGSVPVKVEEIKEGNFRITSVYFIMSGFWEIRVRFVKNDHVIEEQAFSLDL